MITDPDVKRVEGHSRTLAQASDCYERGGRVRRFVTKRACVPAAPQFPPRAISANTDLREGGIDAGTRSRHQHVLVVTPSLMTIEHEAAEDAA